MSEAASDPTQATRYDAVVLGGGSGGYACALRAAQLGLSVVLVEQHKLGGACLHAGCIPTKALLHSAEVPDVVRGSELVGVRASYDGVDMAGVMKYKQGIISRLHRGLSGLVAHQGIRVVEGRGRLVASDTVDVDGMLLRGGRVVLATGSSPRALPGVEVDGRRIVTSEHALELAHVPRSVVVLGGGVIGCEFASIWRSFGAEVTIVEALPRLLPTEDEAVSKQLERGFRKRKIGYRLGTRLDHAKAGDASVGVTVSKDGKVEILESELLLVAVGRGPVTDGLGYQENGIELDRGFVRTDERLRTTVPGVFAVGDIVAGVQLAHRGFQQGVFVAEEIAGLGPSPVEETGIPRVTYCEPEVASVGLTEAAAREQLSDVGIVRYDLGGNGKSQILGTQGFVKLVRSGDRVVGVHLVGSRVSELIGEAQLLVEVGVPISDAARLVHAHPTQNEALGEALLALAGKPLHAHD